MKRRTPPAPVLPAGEVPAALRVNAVEVWGHHRRWRAAAQAFRRAHGVGYSVLPDRGNWSITQLDAHDHAAQVREQREREDTLDEDAPDEAPAAAASSPSMHRDGPALVDARLARHGLTRADLPALVEQADAVAVPWADGVGNLQPAHERYPGVPHPR